MNVSKGLVTIHLAICSLLCLLAPDRVQCNVVVDVQPNEPFNPIILVNSSRPEMHYNGPLHPFGTAYGMRQISLKMEMTTGQHQCYYFVLMQGYQFSVFAATVSPGEKKFHLFLANSDSGMLRTYSDEASVSMVENVTATDTYEVCLINGIGTRAIMFSAVYYQPARYESEVSAALTKVAESTNVTDTNAKYISTLEVNIGKALSSIRYRPTLYRDYVILKESNAYVQWKSIVFIALMMASFGGTTAFIRYLFHVPQGKVTI